jgi:hypothetical protein
LNGRSGALDGGGALGRGSPLDGGVFSPRSSSK